jgi:hypothetical protein
VFNWKEIRLLPLGLLFMGNQSDGWMQLALKQLSPPSAWLRTVLYCLVMKAGRVYKERVVDREVCIAASFAKYSRRESRQDQMI